MGFWDAIEHDIARAAADPAALGVAVTLDGTPTTALIQEAASDWLPGLGTDTDEHRYSLLLPRAEFPDPPDLDALISDGARSFRLAEAAVWDGPFWRAALRLITHSALDPDTAWTDQGTDLAAVASDAAAFGRPLTLGGQALTAIIDERTESWFDTRGRRVRERRYALLAPRADLSSRPTRDTVLLDDQDRRFQLAETARIDGPFWRAALRILSTTCRACGLLTADGRPLDTVDHRRLKTAA